MLYIKPKCYRLAKLRIGTSIINLAAVLTQKGNVFRRPHQTHLGRLVKGAVERSRRTISGEAIGTGRLDQRHHRLDIAGK